MSAEVEKIRISWIIVGAVVLVLSSLVPQAHAKVYWQDSYPIEIAGKLYQLSLRIEDTISATAKLPDPKPEELEPIEGARFIFPTRGKITQGFYAGHYALDISDNSKPPVWAAATGKVVKASSGTWGGGQGNYIIIDHGDGFKTLYSHLDHLDVKVGDVVKQGQVIGQMGNTGDVKGRTGIHLHWEVIKDGIKQDPADFY